jgi:16S rRNA (uracil1498-N3)-methyltransferase
MVMRLHRFFIKERVAGESFKICEERLIHQWRNVFRYNTGSEVCLFDGSGFEYSAVIESLSNREAMMRIVSKRKGVLPEKKIVLFQSLVKKDNMEWIAEKATELGVSKIVPVVSERSEKKDLNIERLEKIVIEASEQCGRADVPEMGSIEQLASSLEGLEGEFVVFDSSGVSFDPSLFSTDYKLLSIFIGPEGGWSPKEIEEFKNAGAKVYSLGKLTLRAETAVIAALSKFL